MTEKQAWAKKQANYLELQEHFLPLPESLASKAKTRRIRVLLPSDYAESQESYPVVYCHDGQNIFYSREAFSGHSWKIIPCLKRNPQLPKMIVVGIDHANEDRLTEFSAWKFSQNALSVLQGLGGKGEAYAEFLLKTVKPFIQANYRVKTEAKYNALLGSSLGGSITQYIAHQYPEHFSQYGVFSSATWLFSEFFEDFFHTQVQSEKWKENKEKHRYFLQVGTAEGNETDRAFQKESLDQAYIDMTLQYYQLLLKAGISLEQMEMYIVAGAKHSEEVWAKFLPSCLSFFSQLWKG